MLRSKSIGWQDYPLDTGQQPAALHAALGRLDAADGRPHQVPFFNAVHHLVQLLCFLRSVAFPNARRHTSSYKLGMLSTLTRRPSQSLAAPPSSGLPELMADD